MSSPHLRIVAVVALLALAGCTYGVGGADPAAPTAGTGGTTPGGEGTDAFGTDAVGPVSLENSSLDLPADRIVADVEAMLGEDVERPRIEVLQLPTPNGTEAERGESTGSDSPVYFAQTPYRFAQHLALDEVGIEGDAAGLAAGTTDQFGFVRLRVANATRDQQVKLFVHEYVHVVQVRSGMLPWSLGELAGDLPTDEEQAKWALTEGAAVWATDQYVDRHLDGATSQSTVMADQYERASVGSRFALARYHLGATGVDRHLDDPAALRDLYRPPIPNTTEQVIHGYRPGEEPMDPVAVDASAGDGWAPVDADDEDRLGELFVRVALSKELSLNESASAAAGWGYDRLVAYEREDAAAFAWVTRWDDSANASEFAAAFETYADRRNTSDSRAFGVERAGDEVVVVYSGPRAFVDAASTDADGETVRVRVGK